MRRLLEDREVERDGVTVRVTITRELTRVDRNGTLIDHAEVRARERWGPLELEAEAGSYFFALGRQDALVGHAGFDDRYIVKASDEDALRYWFGPTEADAVLMTYDANALHPYALTVDGEGIRLVGRWPHGEWNETSAFAVNLAAGALILPVLVTRLDEAIAAVATLAGRGRRLAGAWRERLRALGPVEGSDAWATDEAHGFTVERGRTRIRVDFPWQLSPLRRRGLRTRLAIAWPDAGAAAIWPRAWTWRAYPRIDHGQDLKLPAPWHGKGHATEVLAALPDLPAALAAAGIEWLTVGGGRLAVGWERIVDERDRLAAAAAQLERWSEQVAATRGPYR
ncbi:MAG TPA: hypothetical protein VHE35_17795 [Kofleriaceae bacterium]|nr:hypothetical protein [Kofleriaceae bacterium]